MNQACKKYLRQVYRAMRCPKTERDRLLAGFIPELEESFPQDVSPAELTSQYGEPKTLANELVAALPESMVAQYEKNRRKKWIIATATCVVMIGLLAGFLFWLGSIDVYVPPQNTKIIYTNDYVE